jgi:hypothetical protein
MISETTLRHGCYILVILIASSQFNNHQHIVYTQNSRTDHNSWGDPKMIQKVCLPWGKAPCTFPLFLSFFFFFKKQKTEIKQNQTLQHTGHLTHGKPTYAPPRWVPVSVCLEKTHMPLLPASQFQNCLSQQVSVMQHIQIPHPPPLEHNPMQFVGRLNLPWTKLTNIDSELQSTTEPTLESGDETRI